MGACNTCGPRIASAMSKCDAEQIPDELCSTNKEALTSVTLGMKPVPVCTSKHKIHIMPEKKA
eukprot:1157288-Pelagomonas_calceolata.AAC.5